MAQRLALIFFVEHFKLASLEYKSEQQWNFQADSRLFKLASEAYRLKFAYLFEPYAAVHTSAIEPLPHQISAVYQELLPRLPLHYVLADDPGAGKTIMTGLFIKELLLRGSLERCLIVSPGSLAEQWQEELASKFNLNFEILTNEKIQNCSSNIFDSLNFCIARLDQLARNSALQNMLSQAKRWDLIVCDEAHKMAATVFGKKIYRTGRFKLGQLLRTLATNFLLLTATPHNGKNEDFQLFMSLVDPDRFEGANHGLNAKKAPDVSDLMRRLVKEKLLKFDGTPLFPERVAHTVQYNLSRAEASLYEHVTEYVRCEFNRAEKLNDQCKNRVGFALTILQRRLASSPEAIYQSLSRRRQRLEEQLQECLLERCALNAAAGEKIVDDYDDELSAADLDDFEDNLSCSVSAARSAQELEAEISSLYRLEEEAKKLVYSGTDSKWAALSDLLQDKTDIFSTTNGQQEKLIIFTEHRDTLNYLQRKITNLIGNTDSVAIIAGGMSRSERRLAEELFKHEEQVYILLATDAAGEGINLQRAHLMINYDLPWNPNRLEQRFGRIHRIGQSKVCHLWNLVAIQTREGQVFERLLAKLEEEKAALGGQVFDILGKINFDNKSLRQLLIEAIRQNDSAIENCWHTIIDNSLATEKLQKIIQEQALTEDILATEQVYAIKKDLERAKIRQLQPYFIEAFFLQAFAQLKGRFRVVGNQAERGRYEILHVPSQIYNYARQSSKSLARHYKRICFAPELVNIPNQVQADLVNLEHSLLQAVVGLSCQQWQKELADGAILVDRHDESENIKLLTCLENTIVNDGQNIDDSVTVLAKKFDFVEIDREGNVGKAGAAPYLDYAEPSVIEKALIIGYIKTQAWLHDDLAKRAKEYALQEIAPQLLLEVEQQREPMFKKIKREVEKRLNQEIRYYDSESVKLAQDAKNGKANADSKLRYAEEQMQLLQARKEKRLQELAREAALSFAPPIIVSGALVVSQGLLYKLNGYAEAKPLVAHNKKQIEQLAMQAVINIEKSLGNLPKDVSAAKCGYDIESEIVASSKNGKSLRFIEVKGRTSGAATVTVSKNEILTGLNKPEEFILAIVEVDGNKTKTVYLKRPFVQAPDISATSINYNIDDLLRYAEIVYQD